MATHYDNHWPIIRKYIVDRINANGTAEVHSVIYALQNDNTIPRWQGVQINSEEVQTIIAPLIESRLYVPYYKNEDEVYLSKSTTYEMEEITKTTNQSLQTANASTHQLNIETTAYYKQLEIATWVIAIATLVNVIVAALPYITKFCKP
jgi:hypothetical protein